MNITSITPHMCETMYCHYDDRIKACKNPEMKKVLQKQQDYYLEMHMKSVPFHQVVSSLDIIQHN